MITLMLPSLALTDVKVGGPNACRSFCMHDVRSSQCGVLMGVGQRCLGKWSCQAAGFRLLAAASQMQPFWAAVSSPKDMLEFANFVGALAAFSCWPLMQVAATDAMMAVGSQACQPRCENGSLHARSTLKQNHRLHTMHVTPVHWLGHYYRTSGCCTCHHCKSP